MRTNGAGGAFLAVVSMAAVACGGGSDGDDVGDDAQVDAPVGGVDAFGAGPPIEAPDDTWTWVPFPESRCMNDTATGIGVNWHSDSSELLIYLEGGGACFNAFTCATVAHQGGFGESDMTDTANAYGDAGVFNRADPDNPFRDWNYVFVPYCSGDVHAGSADEGFGGRTQLGYQNIGHYLDRLSPTFPNATRVVLTGSSAGGFGAAFNYDRVATAFGGRPTFLLDDSGPPMSDTYLTPCLQTQVRDAWNLAAALPADCDECTGEDGGGLVNLASYLGTKYSAQRQGLISSNRDGVIRTFFGFGYPTCSSTTPMPEPTFADGIEELTTLLAPSPGFRAFILDSSVHVWLIDPTLGGTTSEGVSLTDWLRAFLDGGADWVTVSP
jgi:hypothetical protein